jgi:hypothetical protein
MRWAVSMLLVVAGCDQLLGLTPVGDGGAAGGDGSGNSGDARYVPWTFIQVTSETGSDQLKISATQENDLIVVGIETGIASHVMSVTDNANNAYAPVGMNTYVTDNSMLSMDLYYAEGAGSGATMISVALDTKLEPNLVVAWEFSGIVPTHALDTSAGLSGQSQAPPASPSIATSRVGELVIAAVVSEQPLLVLETSTFTEDVAISNNSNSGWAHLTMANQPSASYMASWIPTSPDSSYCSVAAAFIAGE